MQPMAMKAIRVTEFGGPEVLKVASDVAIPVAGPNEVLVEIHAVGVNPVETYIRAGIKSAVTNPKLPFTPGSDAAGVVAKVGSTQLESQFKVGDRVFVTRSTSGVYGQFATVEAPYCHPLKDSLTFSQGAAIGIPYFTAYEGLFELAKIKKGETVLVHGASGAVGLACVEMAVAYGATVIGTAGTAEGLELVKKVGAAHVFHHREAGYTEKIKSITGKGVDVVMEMLADVNLATDCELTAFRGRIVIIGCRGPATFEPIAIMSKDISVIGFVLFNVSQKEHEHLAEGILKLIDQGFVNPIVSKEYPLDQASATHHDILEKSTLGKLVILPKK